MRRKVIEPIRGWFDNSRDVMIPAGEIIESTAFAFGRQVRVHWNVVTEGQGYVMVNQDELESCSALI